MAAPLRDSPSHTATCHPMTITNPIVAIISRLQLATRLPAHRDEANLQTGLRNGGTDLKTGVPVLCLA
ncbi:hypothetical protein CPLU01_06641 [Colletotrichum plurivorum]|uniref:Uncharacterized protein n=1 Tax=Colletotrichum plurivorum TaxID=2175906 RepID=A0A8H6NFG0_9PEZI|nr:hypothetical protein CPLU01_06641 [Colletotrichum plurivorum]